MAGLLAAGRGLDARDTLTLALSHEGRGDPLAGLGAWFRMAGLLAAGRGLDARDTLTLALSHEGRGDPLVGIWGWFRMAGLLAAAAALARVTLTLALSRKGRGIRWVRSALGSGGDRLFAAPSLRAFALNFSANPPRVLANVCGRDARAPRGLAGAGFEGRSG